MVGGVAGVVPLRRPPRLRGERRQGGPLLRDRDPGARRGPGARRRRADAEPGGARRHRCGLADAAPGGVPRRLLPAVGLRPLRPRRQHARRGVVLRPREAPVAAPLRHALGLRPARPQPGALVQRGLPAPHLLGDRARLGPAARARPVGLAARAPPLRRHGRRRLGPPPIRTRPATPSCTSASTSTTRRFCPRARSWGARSPTRSAGSTCPLRRSGSRPSRASTSCSTDSRATSPARRSVLRERRGAIGKTPLWMVSASLQRPIYALSTTATNSASIIAVAPQTSRPASSK